MAQTEYERGFLAGSVWMREQSLRAVLGVEMMTIEYKLVEKNNNKEE
jgi:hypothetical protein